MKSSNITPQEIKVLPIIKQNNISSGKFVKLNIIGNFKNPLVSREQLNKQGFTNG